MLNRSKCSLMCELKVFLFPRFYFARYVQLCIFGFYCVCIQRSSISVGGRANCVLGYLIEFLLGAVAFLVGT